MNIRPSNYRRWLRHCVYDLALWFAFSSYACVALGNYRVDVVHAAITGLDCFSVENIM